MFSSVLYIRLVQYVLFINLSFICSAGVGLGHCFGLLTYLVVISAMAKPQEILIPSYKDPERHSMLQNEKKSSACAYLGT